MLLSENPAVDPLAVSSSQQQRPPGQPLSDEEGYRQLDVYLQREADKRDLSSVSGIVDDAMLRRLVDAGFTPETLPALWLAPIAFVAWASGSVTENESQAAMSAIFETNLYRRPAAVAKVQCWLDVQPGKELWNLWYEVTHARLAQSLPSVRKVLGQKLLRQATRVAIASGGVFGFGSVCASENAVLESIRQLYYRSH